MKRPTQIDHESRKRKKTHEEAPCEPPPALLDLLDFTGVELGESSEVATRFDRIAKALLQEYHIELTNEEGTTHEYNILELEFYLKADGHGDPFTHGSEEQKISGNWYFHRAPRRSANPDHSATSLTGYRGGTRKGLDLTIGKPPVSATTSPYFSCAATATTSNNIDIRGGILFRTIQRRDNSSQVISGPSLLVDEILRASSVQKIPELVDQKWGGDRSAFRSSTKSSTVLRLTCSTSNRDLTVYRSPRIGLDLSHPGTAAAPSDKRVTYLSRAYRYFVQPALLTANGRCQTLLGVYEQSADDGLSEEKMHRRISELTGIKLQTVEKYLRDYQTGISDGDLTIFIGPSGKGVCSSPSRYLQMMGALRTFQQS
ncbi:hypothetical protein CCMSSC00406_0008868 [Pleurotus cornucopiae]|uniref:Uncharacterized protein n=1 Tax=Pleurotus cornucopiae TaxID=5321 RepID=A0ACB7IKR3_PLECO|nr:hypothetical protein CCMSSC00406_0008868 [Pleurotus cornucopiae]